MKRWLLLLAGMIFSPFASQAQDRILYKEIDTTRLFLEVHQPPEMSADKTYPAIIFFYGGGWKRGNLSQFRPHAAYFAQRGMKCFLAEYRVESKHQTTPFEALTDAKSAMRYLRGHAKELGIDPNRIVAAGGSAGGHLAAATALSPAYDDPADDLGVSCIPNALMLYNPVIDNGPGGFGYKRVGDVYKDFSPIHNIRKGAPPTLFYLGTEDLLIPVSTAETYQQIMEKVGSRCELKLYLGEGHGFFNYRCFDNYRQTIQEADQFLQSLGYLTADPKVEIK